MGVVHPNPIPINFNIKGRLLFTVWVLSRGRVRHLLPMESPEDEETRVVDVFLQQHMNHHHIQNDPPVRIADEAFAALLMKKLDIMMHTYVPHLSAKVRLKTFETFLDLCQKVLIRLPTLFHDGGVRERNWLLLLIGAIELLDRHEVSSPEVAALSQPAIKLAIAVLRVSGSRSPFVAQSGEPELSLAWNGTRTVMFELLAVARSKLFENGIFVCNSRLCSIIQYNIDHIPFRYCSPSTSSRRR